MNEKYEATVVEALAQAHWEKSNAYKAIENDPRFPKGKFYVCSMLPYPSGKLHMGHVRNYTINDVMYRYMRMNGYNVLSPMGWDAFGLPAENAAIEQGVAPAQWTYQNIADMKSQMQPLGFAFDWEREMTACDPGYYKWNQWMFLKMLEAGIAYRKTQVVNWDPIDQTVLANEQVIDGKGWRTGAVVEKREVPGYYLGITQYAQELLDCIDSLGWPDRVKLMQANWLGRSTGVRFAFVHDVCDASGHLIGDGKLYVFTTRVDTIMGATFMVVAPEHPFAEAAAAGSADVRRFIEECRNGVAPGDDLSDDDKKGMPTGQFVHHPVTGESVPVWVGNYVLMAYGDGAVMAVPAHDERDFAFAKKYQLPIKQVVAVEGQQFTTDAWHESYASKNGYCINSDQYDDLTFDAAVDQIAADLAARDLGEKRIQWRIRDWGISRQRYWGTPIPIIHCEDCGPVPVPAADLPVVLPEDLVPDGSGNPLNKHEAFLKCQCPRCDKPARRETDTMDTFVDSAWYYMRYCSPGNDEAMVDERNDYWMPMDQYIGGIEHAVLHLLYARFWTKVMRDLKLIKFDEPFTNLFTQGMLLNESYYREEADGRIRWFYPSDVELTFDEKGKPSGAKAISDGLPLSIGGIEKMSKSKNNVVLPGDIIGRYGADTARLFTMFAGPPDQSAAWSASGVEGATRFLRRLWAYGLRMGDSFKQAPALTVDLLDQPATELRREVHLVLKQANYDYERLQYNTVVSAGMKLLNALEAVAAKSEDPKTPVAAISREAYGILLRVLYPVVPHICHVIWESLDYSNLNEGNALLGEIIDAPWPQVDENALVQSELTLVLQVNGKVRGKITVPADMDQSGIKDVATSAEAFQRHAQGKPVRKVVVVPGKLVNVVV